MIITFARHAIEGAAERQKIDIIAQYSPTCLRIGEGNDIRGCVVVGWEN